MKFRCHDPDVVSARKKKSVSFLTEVHGLISHSLVVAFRKNTYLASGVEALTGRLAHRRRIDDPKTKREPICQCYKENSRDFLERNSRYSHANKLGRKSSALEDNVRMEVKLVGVRKTWQKLETSVM